MSLKIKVQDGIVTYSAVDPTLSLEFNVNGQANISDELVVGNNSLIDGLITTPAATNLTITTGAGANLILLADVAGELMLNTNKWPAIDGTSGESIVTDGAGQLYWSAITGAPYFIPVGQTFTVPLYNQVIYIMPIDVEGDLIVDGFLIEG